MNAEDYMKVALAEAEKGMGFVNPNPMVGAVIVKNDKIISTGYHHKYGECHAERNAIENCSEDLTGAEMYVTLEPCCHEGKTPPCTQAIINSKIKKIYIGSDDPNPVVSGKGIEILRTNGIEVETGILKEECDKLNKSFFHYITTGKPYVVMKYAMTADGKIASYTGQSKWISNEKSRLDVQKSRLRYSSIMIGLNTVLADDSRLTCRLENGRDPIRIICDSSLKTPLNSFIMQTAKTVPTIIACTEKGGAKKAKIYERMGVNVVCTETFEGHVDLKDLMKKLGERNIDSILLEGGSELNFSALRAGIVNHVQAYIAPKLLGGGTAESPVCGLGFESPFEAVKLSRPEISRFDDDILVEWEVL